jgi:hypothetical protein
MKHKQLILIALTAGVILPLVGCSSNAHRAGAERRWQRLLEQTRLDAAQESIEQGRLDYAILLLEDLIESNSAFADQARHMLAELRLARQKVAQARTADAAELEVVMLY